MCIDQVIIVWVLTPCRFVFRHRGFEETCSIHGQLVEFYFERTAAARKMVAVHSTETHRRAYLRYLASRKTTFRPQVFDVITVSVSISHNVECKSFYTCNLTQCAVTVRWRFFYMCNLTQCAVTVRWRFFYMCNLTVCCHRPLEVLLHV